MNTDIDLRNCLLSNFCNLIAVHLDGSHYVTWKFLLETMLNGCGLMKFIDGSFPCPSQYMITEENESTSEITTEYINWKQNDYAVMTLLAATLSSEVLSFVVGSITSRELWCLLKGRYASTSWFNKEQLKSNFYKLQKGSDSIDNYLDRVKIACDQLANVGIHMTDEDIIVSGLLGLPSNYTTMKTIIRAKPTPISSQELRSLLLIAEAELDEIDKSISLPRYASAPTLVTNDKYDANATMPMMPTSSVASSIGYTVQSMSNLGYTMSDAHKAPAVSNGICYATASIPKRDFIYAANTVLNNESQGDFVQQFSSPSQSADVLHQHFGHSQQHLNHCRNSTTDSFVTGLYTQPNTDFTQQHSGYSMHNSNHDSSGGFVPNHNTASQPLYFTNTSSPIAVTPSLATCGRISQVHNGCFPQTSSFLQQRGFSQPFASCTSTTKQNVCGCFPQSTGFIAQSEGIQRSYGNEIGNGVQGYNGSHQLHNNSQNARGSGSHGDTVDVNNRTEQHAEALVCSSPDHGDYEKDGPLPMGTHDNNLVGSSFKAKMSSTESNKDVVEDHMNNGSYQGIQQVQQKIQQTNAFQQNNGSQHNGGFMKQQPNRSGYSAQRCYHRNSQPLNIALSSYVECQLCRRPGHIAKICRYKQWPSNSSQNTQLSSYTSMPLIPPG